MTEEIRAAWENILMIKAQERQGELDYYEARDLAQTYINTINEAGEKVARKYRKAYYPLTFAKATR